MQRRAPGTASTAIPAPAQSDQCNGLTVFRRGIPGMAVKGFFGRVRQGPAGTACHGGAPGSAIPKREDDPGADGQRPRDVHRVERQVPEVALNVERSTMGEMRVPRGG